MAILRSGLFVEAPRLLINVGDRLSDNHYAINSIAATKVALVLCLVRNQPVPQLIPLLRKLLDELGDR